MSSNETRRGGAGQRRPPAHGLHRLVAVPADQLDAAVDQVLAALGGDTPRHVALSALLLAGAEHAPEVTQHLAHEKAAQLHARLTELQQNNDPQ